MDYFPLVHFHTIITLEDSGGGIKKKKRKPSQVNVISQTKAN
jgi:hypothetical protein